MIAVDIGGSTVRAALIRGRIIRSATRELRGSSADGVFEEICAAIRAVRAPVHGIGIGAPGPLDQRTGTLLAPPNLPFRNFPLAARLRKEFHVPVRLENDANCFALGEALFRKGKGHRSVIGIILGTGVGGGIVLDGRLYAGRGNAGEFGHMPVSRQGRCGCGKRGCLELHASGRAVVRYARRRGLRAESAREVSVLAAGGNRKAHEAFAEMGRWLGLGLAQVVHALDPDIIVLGGGVSKSWPLFRKATLAAAREHCIVPLPPIVQGSERSSLLGAAENFRRFL